MRTGKVGLILAIILILSTISANASICEPRIADKNNPYAYTVAFVEALTIAKEAVDRSEAPTTSGALAAARAFMTTMKLMKRDYDCAASHLSGYTISDNEAIKTSAEAGVVVFISLR